MLFFLYAYTNFIIQCPCTVKPFCVDAQGYKSLEDLEKKTDLTFQQKIGLKYYDDINEKMLREEVAQIESHVM